MLLKHMSTCCPYEARTFVGRYFSWSISQSMSETHSCGERSAGTWCPLWAQVCDSLMNWRGRHECFVSWWSLHDGKLGEKKWNCLEVYRAFISLILPANLLSTKNQVEETRKHQGEQRLQQVVTMSDFIGVCVTVACAHIPWTYVHVSLQIHSVYVCTLYEGMNVLFSAGVSMCRNIQKKNQNIGDNCIYKESLFCSDLEYFLWEVFAFKVK